MTISDSKPTSLAMGDALVPAPHGPAEFVALHPLRQRSPSCSRRRNAVRAQAFAGWPNGRVLQPLLGIPQNRLSKASRIFFLGGPR
jgi:hypothetical protein